MQFDLLLLKWILWFLTFSLILGGNAWYFPEGGNYWLKSVGLSSLTQLNQ